MIAEEASDIKYFLSSLVVLNSSRIISQISSLAEIKVLHNRFIATKVRCEVADKAGEAKLDKVSEL